MFCAAGHDFLLQTLSVTPLNSDILPARLSSDRGWYAGDQSSV